MRDPNKPWKNPPPLSPWERLLRTGRATTRQRNDDVQLAHDVFALASLHLVDWPEAERRMAVARHYVLRALEAEEGRVVMPEDDLWFATRMIIRTLDGDVGLTPNETVAVLDAIGMPTDAVALHAPASTLRGSAANVLVAAATRAAISKVLAECPARRDELHDCNDCNEPREDDLDGDSHDQPEDDDGYAVAA